MKVHRNLYYILIVSIALGCLSGCRSTEEVKNSASEITQICQESLIFDTIYQDEYYTSVDEPNIIIVGHQDEVVDIRQLIQLPDYIEDPFSLVDFADSFIVTVFLGSRPWTGHSIDIENICRNDDDLLILAQEFAPTGGGEIMVEPYHIVAVKKDDRWNQDVNFVLFLDGQQVFTQTHFIPNPPRIKTLAKNSELSGWTGRRPNFFLIATVDEISSVADLISPEEISSLQNVDYSQSYAVVAFQGQQPSGGYAIEIERISRQENRVVIHTQTTEPIEGADVQPEVISPYHLIQVDRFYENGAELDFVLSVDGTEVLIRTHAILDMQ